MGQTGKPNGGPQAAGNSDTLARIARLISIGDEPEAANDAGPEAKDDSAADGTAPAPATLTELTSGQLLEALPAGLAICLGNKLVNANSAFALAFGYRTLAELEKAGGFAAIFPDGLKEIEGRLNGSQDASPEPVQIQARTCSGRKFRVPLAVHAIPSETDEAASLVVLHPDRSIFAEQEQPRAQPEPERTVSADAALRDSGGPGGGDAPKKKKKKAKKKSARQIESSDLGKTDFLVKVSHELRTPLNSIIGFAEIMKDEQLGPIGNDRYRGYIRDILDSGVYALSLVNDLLDISKIESGEFELNFTAVDLDEVISESVHSMQPQAQRQRVLLRTSFEEDLPPILADRRSIRQIILNLVSNAIKFTRPGGQVIVSAQATGSGGVRIRVRDTGIGMSKNEIAVALKPFRQVESPPRGEPGTGLGLPLTKALVEANRAKFKLRSVSKAGTRIDVTFPKDRVAEPRD